MNEMHEAHRKEMEELAKSIDKASQSADVFAKIRDKSNVKVSVKLQDIKIR